MSKEVKQIPTFIWDYDKINNALDFKIIDDALSAFLVVNDKQERVVIYQGNMKDCLVRYQNAHTDELKKLDEFKVKNKKLLSKVKPVKVYIDGKEVTNANKQNTITGK